MARHIHAHSERASRAQLPKPEPVARVEAFRAHVPPHGPLPGRMGTARSACGVINAASTRLMTASERCPLHVVMLGWTNSAKLGTWRRKLRKG